MIAFALGNASLTERSPSGTGTFTGAAAGGGGEGDGRQPQHREASMLQMIHLLFHNMHQNGARFTAGEPLRMIRAVNKAVSLDSASVAKAASKAKHEMEVAAKQRVRSVLHETLTV